MGDQAGAPCRDFITTAFNMCFLCLMLLRGQLWPYHDTLLLRRDFIMTAFNMTEDQAITAITVGIDFSVSQVSQQLPHASTAGIADVV